MKHLSFHTKYFSDTEAALVALRTGMQAANSMWHNELVGLLDDLSCIGLETECPRLAWQCGATFAEFLALAPAAIAERDRRVALGPDVCRSDPKWIAEYGHLVGV